MDFNHEALLVHILFRWLSKVNTLAHLLKIKDKLILFFLSSWQTRSSFVSQSKEIYLVLASLLDIFEALNDLYLILQGKNINCINDYDTVNTFLANLALGMFKVKKKIQLPFLN